MNNRILLQSNYIRSVFGNTIEFIEIDSEGSKTDQTIKLFVRKQNIEFVSKVLKKHSFFKFSQLLDISAVDFPNLKDRFLLMYNFLSPTFSSRLILKSSTSLDDPVQSMSREYNSAIWLEREVWDLFGIFFYDHPDLRRILTDYGFQGFPLRNDFPLIGYSEVRYDDEKKQIVQEPVELSQEFRAFDFLSPWERK